MEKDFDKWNDLKKSIGRSATTELFFHEREIWHCSIGINVGHEQNGVHDLFERPVLILKKLSSETFIGIPITSKLKKGSWYLNFAYKDQPQTLLLNQIRLFDKRRLSRKIAFLEEDVFIKAKERARQII